ncbi:MAG: DUF411 domain-containing protein [Zwartia sp.]|nr:DUF411 domain-containing protein [Zwartia sp.]MDO9023777.1 DUF411 domain-containing protein [Zwartia sp.]
MKSNGFDIQVNNNGNQTVHTKLGVKPKYGYCYTAVVAGYFIEGHVPAKDVIRFLKKACCPWACSAWHADWIARNGWESLWR